MAGSLLALLDDIATLLDDISVMSKVAAKKTAGVLGDDLAVNAEQVSGIRASREIPVVWEVAKGSFLNKLIIVPLVLLLSAFLPWLITPLLMMGGIYLCFEGAEKIWHAYTHRGHKDHSSARALLKNNQADLIALERDKIKGAIRTDLILSLEIIVISISTMADESIKLQAMALSLVAIVITVGVYGLVALIVKIDDLGLHLVKGGDLANITGRFLLWFSPAIMKSLTVLGTIAMFLVGGGILYHGLEHYFGHALALAHWLVSGESMVGEIVQVVIHGLYGVVAGATVVYLSSLFKGKAVREKSGGQADID